MSPEIRQRAKELLGTALDLDAEGQEQFLARECAGDAPLLAALRSLLRHARQAEDEGFLAAPTSPQGEVVREVEGSPIPSGNWVGSYRIEREIGRGGMAVVYLAHQAGLNRAVAVKMILTGAYAGPDDLARFRKEAEAVARLQHPNIVQIHEVGEQDGRPYFSLEYVAGGSLDKKLGGTPRPAVEAARLLETLARAVHCAHEHGIVHRDLKPANVLLAADGTPKITDFGLAKQLDAGPGSTQPGAILGTPSYMPPEQAEGRARDVGPLADVYALGAVLYELLTGRPPFKGTTLLETLELVRTKEPVPPAQLRPNVPRDLETICLKCLEKAPRRRYAAARDLADDLGRFLRGEPVRARPVGRRERLWRWCGRNPRLAALTLTVAALLIFTAAGSAIGSVLIWEAKQRADRARQDEAAQKQLAQARAIEAQEKRQLSQDNLQVAFQVLDKIYLRVAEERLPRDPQREEEDRELLRQALTFYEEFARRNEADPDVRYETGRAYLRVGDIQERLGQLAAAEQAYRRAVDLVRPLATNGLADPDQFRALARGWTGLGGVLTRMSRYQEADREFQQLEAVLDTVPDGDRKEVAYRQARAALYTCQVVRLTSTGDNREAEPRCRQALELHEQLAKEFPDSPVRQCEAAKCHLTLAAISTQLQRFPEARKAYDKALALQAALAARWPDDVAIRVALATGHRSFARFLRMTGNDRDAQAAYLQARAEFEKLVARFPNVPSYRGELGETLHGLAIVLHQSGDSPRARGLLEQALEQQRKALGPDPNNPIYRSRVRNHLFILAAVLVDLGEHADAARRVAEVTELADRTRDFFEASRILAECVARAEKDTGLPEQKRKELAKEYATRAVDMLRKITGRELGEFDFKKAPEFDPLRSYSVFRELLRELPSGPPAP